MQKKNCIVWAQFIPSRTKTSATKNCPVPGPNRDVLKLCIELPGAQLGQCLCCRRQTAPTWVERPLRQQNSCDETEECITSEQE
jgi:hypothetical protein